jgi:hypothetical protein
MSNHKATPEQWKADKYDWSKADTEAMDNDSAFRCILELRSRIEQLEAQANHPVIPDSSTPPLSPAAQAVLDAVFDHWPGGYNHPGKPRCVAAALCAAADQVVPEESEPSEQPFADLNDRWPTWNANQKTRRKLLAIATELKNHQ